jgi:putative tryptophan/tyrosine transport system substrate-binding protein
MRRRDFISLLSGAALGWPFAARAQRPASKLYRIGMLETVPSALNVANTSAFRKGLQELGYVEGKNYVIEYRSTDGFPERFPQLASELVRLPVDLIVTRGTPAALAARDATTTIPVVMASSGDPVGVGLVASLAHPGGNITGLSSYGTELAAKRIELVRELLPGISRVALLADMSNPAYSLQWTEIERAARVLGLHAELLDVRSVSDIGRAFEVAVARQIGAIVVASDTVVQTNRQMIVDLAAQNRLPVFYSSREFVDAGGLISFRVSYFKLYFRGASFVDKIFKGAKPGDIPIEQPTTLEMVINLKTAKALGLTIPPSIMVRADEVIE